MEVFLDSLVPLFGVIGVFGMPVFIVLIYFYFANKSEKQFHTTLHELIESGQELSPELLQSIPGYKKEKENGERNDIRTGTITTGVGIGIALFGQFGAQETALFGIGLLVFSIGLAFLAYGIYNKDKKVNDVS
jgi:hypothetical protein